ncbi:MAG: NADH-quinone oxidoreductase subunit J [Phycisphaeraceae bacterium]
MQTPLALYIATVLGGLALLLLMPKQRGNLPVLGTLLGGAALGGAWLLLAGGFVGESVLEQLTGLSPAAFSYYYVFSAIAIVAAVRVITHTRPVYSALWFVMVVLSSAGLLLVLAAEFMAFAMIIIYAGAILVTYVFVIMLASQSQSPDAPADAPEVSPVYDRFAREPFSAVVAGFLLLAVLLTVVFPPAPMERVDAARGLDDVTLAQNILADRPQRPTIEAAPETEAEEGELAGQETLASTRVEEPRISNGERIGVDLFRSHPLGLELAGVILLVALIGAVVIAKTHVPEEHEAAG